MHEADRLDGFPEVARGLGRDTVAHIGDLQRVRPCGPGRWHFSAISRAKCGMPLGEGDDGLEHDDDGLQQVPLAQGVGARAHLPEALGLHLLHLGLGQADDVVESVAEHVAAGLHHAAAEGAVTLEQTAVGILTHRPAFEDHGMVEQQVEVLLAELLFQSHVHVVDRVHVLDPVLGVGLELLQVFRIDERRGDVAQLAVELAALAHREDLARLHGAGILLPRMNLVDEPTMISGSRIRMGQFSSPLLERLGPAEIDRHGLGLFPGFGEEQGVVNVDLGSGVFPFLLQLLEAGGHDDRWSLISLAASGWIVPLTTGTMVDGSGVILSPFTSSRSRGALDLCYVPHTEQCSVFCHPIVAKSQGFVKSEPRRHRI